MSCLIRSKSKKQNKTNKKKQQKKDEEINKDDNGRNNSIDDDCNWTRTHNHLLRKRTLNHLAKLASVDYRVWIIEWIMD